MDKTKGLIYTVLGILGGLALTLLLILYLSGFLGGWASDLMQTSDQVFKRGKIFLNAVKEDRYADAYDFMDPNYQKKVSLDEFRHTVEENTVLATLQSGGLGHFRTYGDSTAVYTGSLTSSTRSLEAKIHFTKVNNKWYIIEIVIGGRPVFNPTK